VVEALGIVDRGDTGGRGDGADAGDRAQPRHAGILDGEVLERCGFRFNVNTQIGPT
jgi:hypothetical protein